MTLFVPLEYKCAFVWVCDYMGVSERANDTTGRFLIEVAASFKATFLQC